MHLSAVVTVVLVSVYTDCVVHGTQEETVVSSTPAQNAISLQIDATP